MTDRMLSALVFVYSHAYGAILVVQVIINIINIIITIIIIILKIRRLSYF